MSSPGVCPEKGPVYHSLEEVHVFTLAHVIRRPIIVIAKPYLYNAEGEALAPVHFGGVYLPLLIPAEECEKTPLLLTYEMSHFSALVRMDGEPITKWWSPREIAIPSEYKILRSSLQVSFLDVSCVCFVCEL